MPREIRFKNHYVVINNMCAEGSIEEVTYIQVVKRRIETPLLFSFCAKPAENSTFPVLDCAYAYQGSYTLPSFSSVSNPSSGDFLHQSKDARAHLACSKQILVRLELYFMFAIN